MTIEEVNKTTNKNKYIFCYGNWTCTYVMELFSIFVLLSQRNEEMITTLV